MSKCDCYEKIREKVRGRALEDARKRHPTAEITSACSDGEILFMLGGSPAETFSVFNARAEWLAKSGRPMCKSLEYHMLHAYCPFCGRKYEVTE